MPAGISLRRPSAEAIAAFLRSQSGLAFSYSDVGATASTLPSGFNVDRSCTVVGSGEAVFLAAKAALQEWMHFRLGWVDVAPASVPIEVGQQVAVVGQAFFLYWLNACRIVYVVDDAGPVIRSGFAYGTLPFHAERGEELFLIEWNRGGDEVVSYSILAFSRPHGFLSRLGYPFLRFLQRRFRRDSGRAMFNAVAARTRAG